MALFRRSPRPSVPQLLTDLGATTDDEALLAARDAARAGRWEPAAELLAEREGDHDRRGLSVTVLAETVPDGDGAWVDRWQTEQPDDAAALVVAAQSAVLQAFADRGEGWRPDDAAAFVRGMETARELVQRAAQQAPDDPMPWAVLLWVALGTGAEREVFDRRWKELTHRDPAHREGQVAALQHLAEKWHGGPDDGLALARREAPGSPWGPVLPLQAHQEHLVVADRRQRAGFWQRPDVVADLDAAVAWARTGPTHGRAVHDLSVVAASLAMAERWDEVGEVFALAGDRTFDYPWYYQGDPARAVVNAAKRAAGARS